MSDLIPISEAGRIGYLTGVRRDRAADPRYTFALRAEPIDLLTMPCTCIGSGPVCPVCKAWDAASRTNEIRRLHAVRP